MKAEKRRAGRKIRKQRRTWARSTANFKRVEATFRTFGAAAAEVGVALATFGKQVEHAARVESARNRLHALVGNDLDMLEALAAVVTVGMPTRDVRLLAELYGHPAVVRADVEARADAEARRARP